VLKFLSNKLASLFQSSAESSTSDSLKYKPTKQPTQAQPQAASSSGGQPAQQAAASSQNSSSVLFFAGIQAFK
jgi:hypothetical protein